MRERPITAVEQDIVNRLSELKLFPPTPLIKPHKCGWTKDEDGIWTAACHAMSNHGPSFIFEDGGPKENRFVFCPYCGKPLAE